MALVQFYRGKKDNYSSTTHVDGIYFAQDTLEILMNGDSYGGKVTGASVTTTATGNELILTLSDGSSVSALIASATTDAAGLMSAADKETLDELAETINNLIKYSGENAISVSDSGVISLVIDSSDSVLSQSTNGLKTTLTIDYNSDDHTVNIKGVDGAIISSFDASEFVIDGMIQSAELVHENDKGESGEFLAITFNTEGGQTTTIYIDVAELIDTYTAGNGLALNDHEFSVKIADSDEGYLQSTEAGIKTEGINDAISSAVATETTRAEEKEAELEAAIQAAVAGESKTVVKVADGSTHLTVTESADGADYTYTISETNIASADDLTSLASEVSQLEEAVANVPQWIEV